MAFQGQTDEDFAAGQRRAAELAGQVAELLNELLELGGPGSVAVAPGRIISAGGQVAYNPSTRRWQVRN